MKWIRLYVVVEGQTEETFVNEVLAPHLHRLSVQPIPKLIITSRKGGKERKGGFLKFAHLRRDMRLHIQQDHGPDAWYTTMVDYYAYPLDAPGQRTLQPGWSPVERVTHLENEMMNTVEHDRFIPYIQLHEFEALLFANVDAWEKLLIEDASAVQRLKGSVAGFGNPEEINDSQTTAPSKRIESMIPSYYKPLYGALLAMEVGIEKMRERCPHFAEWLSSLERLAQ